MKQLYTEIFQKVEEVQVLYTIAFIMPVRLIKFSRYCLTQWISKLLSKTVLSACNFLWNKGPVKIWNDHKAQKYVWPVNIFPNFLNWYSNAPFLSIFTKIRIRWPIDLPWGWSKFGPIWPGALYFNQFTVTHLKIGYHTWNLWIINL